MNFMKRMFWWVLLVVLLPYAAAVTFPELVDLVSMEFALERRYVVAFLAFCSLSSVSAFNAMSNVDWKDLLAIWDEFETKRVAEPGATDPAGGPAKSMSLVTGAAPTIVLAGRFGALSEEVRRQQTVADDLAGLGVQPGLQGGSGTAQVPNAAVSAGPSSLHPAATLGRPALIPGTAGMVRPRGDMTHRMLDADHLNMANASGEQRAWARTQAQGTEWEKAMKKGQAFFFSWLSTFTDDCRDSQEQALVSKKVLEWMTLARTGGWKKTSAYLKLLFQRGNGFNFGTEFNQYLWTTVSTELEPEWQEPNAAGSEGGGQEMSAADRRLQRLEGLVLNLSRDMRGNNNGNRYGRHSQENEGDDEPVPKLNGKGGKGGKGDRRPNECFCCGVPGCRIGNCPLHREGKGNCDGCKRSRGEE